MANEIPPLAEILARLIAFETVSHQQNRDLVDWVAALLATAGIEATIIPDASGRKANLFATVGPGERPGVMLSGHTDVVPVEGQNWTHPPFTLRREGGRFHGRGTADMKGFCAAAIGAMMLAATRPLKAPLHLALSYDEEIGCLGVPSLIAMLGRSGLRPALTIVGEPTEMAVATGHKGKLALSADCRGEEGHSALAPMAMNALHLAADFVTALRRKQDEIATTGRRDGDYDVPYTTLHAGRIEGGVQLNIVPASARVEFEIRNLAEDDPQAIIDDLETASRHIVAQASHPAAAIGIARNWSYPGLATAPDHDAVAFVKSLCGANGTIKVAFGTEGGLFSQRLSTPTVICGPGSMRQGHKADEFVTEDQLALCETMLARLVERLATTF